MPPIRRILTNTTLVQNHSTRHKGSLMDDIVTVPSEKVWKKATCKDMLHTVFMAGQPKGMLESVFIGRYLTGSTHLQSHPREFRSKPSIGGIRPWNFF